MCIKILPNFPKESGGELYGETANWSKFTTKRPLPGKYKAGPFVILILTFAPHCINSYAPLMVTVVAGRANSCWPVPYKKQETNINIIYVIINIYGAAVIIREMLLLHYRLYFRLYNIIKILKISLI